MANAKEAAAEKKLEHLRAQREEISSAIEVAQEEYYASFDGGDGGDESEEVPDAISPTLASSGTQTESASADLGDVDEQIVEAEEAGDWDKSLRLKVDKLHAQTIGQGAPEAKTAPPAPPSTEELAARIREAEAAGEWEQAMDLKLADLQRRLT